MTTAKRYPEWTLIDWDGNPDLKLKCWRKSFGRGHASVGVGEFLHVVYSYGPNSENSCCGTRWNYDNPPLSEQSVMKAVDRNKGKHGKIGHTRPANWDAIMEHRIEHKQLADNSAIPGQNPG